MLKKIIKYLFQTLAYIAAIVTILLFVYRNKTELKFKVITNTNVLDIKAEVSKLNIFYDSVNLKETNHMLSILTLQLSNDGFNNIKKDHFDSEFPLGLQVHGGVIIEKPEVIEASSNYLFNALKIRSNNDSTISFSPLLLDRNEWIDIKLLILHGLDVIPVLSSYGKLSGQSEIQIIYLDSKTNNVKNNIGILKGNILTQFIRLLFYPFIVLLIIGLIFLLSKIGKVIWSSYTENHYKKLTVRNFLEQNRIKPDNDYSQIFREYLHGNEFDELFRWSHFLKENKNFKSSIYEDFNRGHVSESTSMINELVRNGYLSLEKGKVILNEPMVEKLIIFTEFVREKGFHIYKAHFGPNEMIYGGKMIGTY